MFCDIQSMILQYDSDIKKASHIFKSNYEMALIESSEMDIFQSKYLTESEIDNIHQNKFNDLINKCIEFIKKVIDSIRQLCKNCMIKIREMFVNDKRFDYIKIVKTFSESPYYNEEFKKLKKVNILTDEKEQMKLNAYIQKLLKYEREIVKLEFESRTKPSIIRNTDVQIMHRIMEIDKKVDELNNQYEKSFLQENEYIINMAIKDAIRFSDKQLENIKIDFTKLESESCQILQAFQKDANGCDVPEQLNLMQKITNSIAAAVRSRCYQLTQYKARNYDTIIGIALTSAAVAAAIRLYQMRPNEINGIITSIKNGTFGDIMKQKFADLARPLGEPPSAPSFADIGNNLQ